MLVKEFVESVKAGVITESNIKDRVEFLDYVGYDVKRRIVDSVLDQVLYIKDGMLTFDSMTKYELFISSVINLYTNIEMSSTEDYDLLLQSGMLDLVFETIGRDFYDYRSAFEMRFEDRMREANTLEAILNSGIQELLFNISPIIDNVNTKIKELDENKILGALGKLDGVVKKFSK